MTRMQKLLVHREIDKLRQHVLALSALVEASVHSAVKAVHERDPVRARSVIDGDPEIDQAEVDLEEECLKLLALHQPVAGDLRYIVAVLKINSDLERIGDLAVDIAERAEMIAARTPCEIPFDFDGMSAKVMSMLRRSRDALVEADAQRAYEVIGADDEIDSINRGMYAMAARAMEERPDRIETLLLTVGISRILERIADHATNIAEDVIYLTTGRIMRHDRGAMGKDGQFEGS